MSSTGVLLTLGVAIIALRSSPCAAGEERTETCTADQPCRDNCSVYPFDGLNGMLACGVSPSPMLGTVVIVTVRDYNNVPLENVHVNLDVNTSVNGNFYCSPPGYDYTQLITDENGQVTFPLNGGGCGAEPTPTVWYRIWADDTLIRDYPNQIKSPDYNGVSGDGRVGLDDLAEFRVAPGGCGCCCDYDNTCTVNIGDLVIFVYGYEPMHYIPIPCP